jgi:NAD-dependent deacetylase
VVFFGEPLPAGAMGQAVQMATECDLMLVVGSSLAVRPAADIPLFAIRRGAPLLIVNDEPTPLDGLATVVVRGRSGEILPGIRQLAGV